MSGSSTRIPVPPDLDRFREDVYQDFQRACRSFYWLNPRSTVDPETGEKRDVGPEGLMRVKLFPEQLIQVRVMEAMKRAGKPVRIIKLKCRQSGDSTLAELWTFHHMYWRSRRRALVVAHHENTTSSLFEMAQTFYAELPAELQLPAKKLNRKELAFESPYGSNLVAQTAGYVNIGHGLTIAHAHLSEVDRWLDPEMALEGIMETVPLAPDTSIIIESVADKGVDGWLYKFWRSSVRGETGFTPVFTPWFKVPEYRIPVPPDFEPTKEHVEWIGKYGLTRAQVAWYALTRSRIIAQMPWGGDRRMKALYPFEDEEAFQSSGLCIFPDVVLRRLKDGCDAPMLAIRLDALPIPGEFRATETDTTEGKLWIWKKPERGRMYALGVDISAGVGQTESVVSVVAWPEYEQVAEWASNRCSPEETAYVTRYLAEMYGGMNALVIPEVNKDGLFLLHLLMNMPGNFSIFRWRYFDRPGMTTTETPRLGWETNVSTKSILGQAANLVFLRGQGIVRSEKLHEQMTKCIDLLPSARWGMESGRSDRVIAFLIAITGAYLDFEGASVGNIVSDRTPGHPQAFKRQPWPHACYRRGGLVMLIPFGSSCAECQVGQERNSYDDAEEIYGSPVEPVGSHLVREDMEGT